MHGAHRRDDHGAGAIEIRTPARFHLGMFSFGDPSIRAFGGTGLMLDRPGIVLRMHPAERVSGTGPHADRAVAFARECAAAWGLAPAAACRIEVVSAPRAHVGLGSGTQLALAVAAGIRELADAADHESDGATQRGGRGFAVDEVLRLAEGVGRGRRSSVGIHGFAGGGLIVEAGRLAAGRTGVERAPGAEGSPLIARAAMPPDWRGLLLIERASEGLHGDAEREAFRSLSPVDRGLTAELVRLAAMDLVPAAIEGRFAEFSSALHAYGRLAGIPFAPVSGRLPCHAGIERLIERLSALGIRGAAQSSWGPAVLACCASETEAADLRETLSAEGLDRTHDLSVVRFDSDGARLERS